MIQEFLNEIQILNCFKYIKVVLIGNDKDLLIDNLAGDEILSFKTKGEFVETPSKGSKSGKTNNKGKNTKN